MSLQGGIHPVIQLHQSPGIPAQQMGCQFTNSGADTIRVGGKVKRAEWTDFSVTRNSALGFDSDDRAVKYRDRFAAGPFVRTLGQRQFHAMGKNSTNLHAILFLKKLDIDWSEMT